MNRRDFLRSLFASSATVVVAPAIAMEILDRKRTYFDMGRVRDVVLVDEPWIVIDPPWDHRVTLHMRDGEHQIEVDQGRKILSVGDSITLERIEFTPEERMRTLSTGGWQIAFLRKDRS